MNEREGLTSAGVFVEMDASDTLTFESSDATADLYVMRPKRTPLSVEEGHAELTLATDDGSVVVELDGEELDVLADAIHGVQKHHQGEE